MIDSFLDVIALCSYPHVKVSIRDLNQIFTTAPIFQQSHYLRQNIWRIFGFTFTFNVYFRTICHNHPHLQFENNANNWNFGDKLNGALKKPMDKLQIFQIMITDEMGKTIFGKYLHQERLPG